MDMVKEYFPVVSAVREVVPEVHFAPERDVPAELVPARDANFDRLLQCLHDRDERGILTRDIGAAKTDLVQRHERLQFLLGRVQRKLLPLHLIRDLFDAGALAPLAFLQSFLYGIQATLHLIG